MNFSMLGFVLARILFIEAGLLSLPLVVSFLYREPWGNRMAYVITMGLLLVAGFLLQLGKKRDRRFYMREAFVMVGLSWILLSFFGGMPFYFSGQIPSFIDCFFETASGFTTTGSTILTQIESLSPSMLFWRSFTHFVGGMGILVFALAVLPRMSTDSVQIMKAEVPGPRFGKLVSKLSVTAKILYMIYIGMTAILTIFLMFGGMNLFDALIHAFGAAGTGGFSNKANSIAYFNSSYIEMVLAVAMVIFGMNFNLHYFILIGQSKDVLKNEELRWYLSIILLAVLLITLNIQGMYKGILESLRHSFFAVSSIMTTTGYSTVDFGSWPLFSKMILLALMCIGACAGSTAGGLKVSRVTILAKSSLAEIKRMRQPKRVISVSHEHEAMSGRSLGSVGSYFIIYMVIVFFLILLMSLDLKDFPSIISSVLATFNNIGPGLGQVGPTGNFAALSDGSKLLLSFAMIAGRLEIFPILILFLPSTWKKTI